MNSNFLDKIVSLTRSRVATARAAIGESSLRSAALDARKSAEPHRLRSALSRRGRINVIAEFKRASPSKGLISIESNLAETVRAYEAAGACAVSVLTEPEYFRGSLEDLRAAREVVGLPLLRKDFVVDSYQIHEAAAAGADAVLLIVAALTVDELALLLNLAERQLGMDALVEVHSKEELDRAIQMGAALIGVNNRDLKSLNVSLDVSRELIAHKPNGTLMITESGISNADEIAELRSLGFDGFLIGETLMRSGDPGATLNSWEVATTK